ncbi:MAG: hypothetical protein ACI9HK_005119 [Pirellulaceae bacterium]|jgi:hypothetical protein
MSELPTHQTLPNSTQMRAHPTAISRYTTGRLGNILLTTCKNLKNEQYVSVLFYLPLFCFEADLKELSKKRGQFRLFGRFFGGLLFRGALFGHTLFLDFLRCRFLPSGGLLFCGLLFDAFLFGGFLLRSPRSAFG